MQKKSKRERRKECQAKERKLQKNKKIEVSLYKKSKENEDEKIQIKLLEIDKSELSQTEKLIQSLILLNPEKLKEGDIVEEDGNVLYYSKMLNMEEFKKLSYPKNYKYQFSKYPQITFNLNGVEGSFYLMRA